MDFTTRLLQPEDNPGIAKVIRQVMEEFHVALPGSVYTDPTTDALYELFKTPESRYWVVQSDAGIVGGGGIYPTQGLPRGYCELVKFYLLPQVRGRGLGKLLIEKCFLAAREYGFTFMYLESFPELQTAIQLYSKSGFEHVDAALGQSGHFACNIWMVKKL